MSKIGNVVIDQINKVRGWRMFLEQEANPNCKYCQGEGIVYKQNGPDDYDEEACDCTEIMDDDELAEIKSGGN